mmetsp:Transcript_35118/g.84184  ORF Transcript_35118/g.84184 Transcript_35118/m.84184 type:complete len:356 (+) Transcript_35118:449-1516(+)
MVNISPDVSIRVTPVFSWISLILDPLGPMTIPILFSGTLIWAVCMLVFSAFSASTCARAAAPFSLTPAMNAAISSLEAAFGAGAMPGTVFVGAMPGTVFLAWAASMACSRLRCSSFSFLFSAFFDSPVDCSQSPPVPSSISKGWTSSRSCFSGSFSTSFGGALFALAPCLAAGFGAALAATGAGAGAGSALALAFPFALGSAGAGAGALAPAFALGSAFAAPFGFAASGAAGAFAAALPLAAAAFGSGLAGSSLAFALGFAAAFGASLALAFGSGVAAAFAFGFFSGTGSGAGGGAASSANFSSRAFLAARRLADLDNSPLLVTSAMVKGEKAAIEGAEASGVVKAGRGQNFKQT